MRKRYARQLARMFGLLIALVSVAIAMQPLGAVAQSTAAGQPSSPQTAGSATVEFSDVWQYDVDASDPETVFLAHADLPGTAFIYAEIVDSSVTDAEDALSQFTDGFFGEFGDGDHTVVDSGVVPTDTIWQLFSVSLDGVPFGVYSSANVTTIPGTVLVTVLLSPAGSFDLAVTSVQEGVSVNGTGTTLSSFDPLAMSASLSGEGATGQASPTAVSTPDTGTDRGGLTLPPLGEPTATPGQTATQPTPADQGTTPDTQTGQAQVQPTGSVTVNGALIAYGGDWTYSEQTSTPDQIAFFLNDVNTTSVFGYATVADTTNDVAQSLAQFKDGFFGSFGATNVVERSTEVLPSGHAYALYTADRGDLPYVVLVLADTSTVPGEFRAQVLISQTEDFGTALPSVQQSFQIDGVAAMSELDAAQLTSLIGGGAPPQPQTQPTETTTSTTQGSAGSVAEFQAADTQGACDPIGWVVLSPDQAPTSEADVNFRAACVGGGAFVAFCGTVAGNDVVAPEAGTTWIRCDVTARADAGPLTLTPLDFSLTDGTGAEYTLDFKALFGMSDASEFPEAAVPAGQTGGGTVAFAVPDTASGPWVLNVNPASLQTSGEEPGHLVVDGELQPFDVFGQ